MRHDAPEFRDQEAQQVWTDYFRRVSGLCASLTPRQRRDIQLEIKAHLLESCLQSSEGSERQRLTRAMERLGQPEDFVPGWVEDRLLQDSAPGGGVRSLWMLLRLNSRRGMIRLFASLGLGFGYMLAFYLFMMGILKPIFPDNVGLITTSKGLTFLGYVDSPEMTDHLGYWLVPIALSLSLLLVWCLGRLIRRMATL